MTDFEAIKARIDALKELSHREIEDVNMAKANLSPLGDITNVHPEVPQVPAKESLVSVADVTMETPMLDETVPVFEAPAPAVVEEVQTPVFEAPAPAVVEEVQTPVFEVPAPAVVEEVQTPVFEAPAPAVVEEVRAPVKEEPAPVAPQVIERDPIHIGDYFSHIQLHEDLTSVIFWENRTASATVTGVVAFLFYCLVVCQMTWISLFAYASILPVVACSARIQYLRARLYWQGQDMDESLYFSPSLSLDKHVLLERAARGIDRLNGALRHYSNFLSAKEFTSTIKFTCGAFVVGYFGSVSILNMTFIAMFTGLSLPAFYRRYDAQCDDAATKALVHFDRLYAQAVVLTAPHRATLMQKCGEVSTKLTPVAHRVWTALSYTTVKFAQMRKAKEE